MLSAVNLYTMKLHEKEYDIDVKTGEGEFTILRVPSGWIYSHWSRGEPHPVFVPFNNEFQ
jgi:hypothetical protein